MPGSDTPHLHQTVTNQSQAGWNQLSGSEEAVTRPIGRVTTTVDLYGHLVPEAGVRARDALDNAFSRAARLSLLLLTE